VPNEVRKEDRCQTEFLDRTGECLLCRYLKLELDQRERVVVENDEFVGLVPFWAIWPFETLVISRRHLPAINQLSDKKQEAFADILLQLTIRYDNLFSTSFPYSMGLHHQPFNSTSSRAWHFHAHFYPPLLRSATVRKFMVGFEMLASPQQNITAETAAKRLRELPGVHYRLAITNR
jgi:UDPglucose--hexose-1-phosphate uridylyltransferase